MVGQSELSRAFDVWHQIIEWGRKYDKHDGKHRDIAARSRDGGVWEIWWETDAGDSGRVKALHSEPEVALSLLASRLKNVVGQREQGKHNGK